MRRISEGTLSPLARRIMDLFRRRSYLTTAKIRELLGRSGSPSRASIEQALSELQGKMYIGRGGDAHTPARFGMVSGACPLSEGSQTLADDLPGARTVVSSSRGISGICLVTTLPEIRHTFRWTRQEIYQALGDLHRTRDRRE